MQSRLRVIPISTLDKNKFVTILDKIKFAKYIRLEHYEEIMLKMGIIGQAARGEIYLKRPRITERIIENLDKGANILLAAPRRVGKSSLLFDLLDNPPKNCLVIYYTSESVNSENEYYKKLFNHIAERLESVKRYTAVAKDFLSRIEEISIKGSVKIGESRISYLSELEKMLEQVDLKSEKLIILNDELASTVENIIRDESKQSAIHFLGTLREIRQSPKFHKKVQFTFAGSIGLENIVSEFGGINLINDLVSIPVPPLAREEALHLIDRILTDSSITISQGGIKHLLNVIEWWIPFYFQILLDESFNILQSRNENVADEKVIDEAVKKALKHRLYFEHWFVRLRKAYQGDEFSFVKDVLNLASENQTISSAEIVNLSHQHKLGDSYKHLLNALTYDGYLNNDEDVKTYRFNSPLLREWWRRNVAN